MSGIFHPLPTSTLEKRFFRRFLPPLLIVLLTACAGCLWVSQNQLNNARVAYGERIIEFCARILQETPSDRQHDVFQQLLKDLAKDPAIKGTRLTNQKTGIQLEEGKLAHAQGADGQLLRRDVRMSSDSSSPADIQIEILLRPPSLPAVIGEASSQLTLLLVTSLALIILGIIIQRQLINRPLHVFHKAIKAHESGAGLSWEETPPPDELGAVMRAYESISLSHREAAEQLIVSQERLRILSDNLPNAFLYQIGVKADGKHYFSYVGDSIREIFGVSPEEVCHDAQILRRRVDPDYLPEMEKLEEQAFRMRAEFIYECPFEFPDGSSHWVQLLSRPSQMPNGEYLWQGVFIDVTETRARDAELQRSRADARTILDALPDPIFVQPFPLKAPEITFTHVNPSACEFLGMTEQELLATGPGIVDDLSPEERLHVRSELANHKFFRFETTFIRKNGTRFPGEICTRIIQFSGQQVAVSVARSLVEQKQNEQKLKDAADQIEKDRVAIAEKNTELSQLLHILCHDLANPISALNGMLNLRKNNPKCDLSECAAISKQVLDLIGIVHKMQGIDKAKQSLALEAVSASDIFEQALQIVKAQLDAKTIQVNMNLPSSLLLRVEPISFVNSVLANALTNAIKFSFPESTIHIQSEIEGQKIILEIKDEGVGMPENLASKIFDPAARTIRQGTAGETGTGFGMPLVKKFMDLYGGEVRITSIPIGKNPLEPAPGHGTTVSLILPLPSEN